MPRTSELPTLERYARDAIRVRAHEHSPMPLYYLRGNDPRIVSDIARGGGPSMRGDVFHLYCPACRCNKSGNVETPNGHGDACENDGCRCHDDVTEIEYQVCIEHPDRAAVVETTVDLEAVGSSRRVPVCDECRRTWTLPERTVALSW